jgi:phenylalanyl-tRNA synthetase alpha chain
MAGDLSCSLRMMNEDIPNLTSFDDASLDRAFGVARATGARGRGFAWRRGCCRGLSPAVAGAQAGAAERSLEPLAEAAPSEAKKALGLRFNALKLVEGCWTKPLVRGPSDAALAAEAIDITLPGTRGSPGPSIPLRAR